MLLYPLRFKPIYQYRPWGGRRLAEFLGTPLPGDGPVGEAWLLSDRGDYPSRVAEGPLEGSTIGQLLERYALQLLGKVCAPFARFPLLLKFLDVSQKLSVQVHPSDAYQRRVPAGEAGDPGKTEAWVVLESGPGARVYAGLKPSARPDTLRQAIGAGTVEDQLARFVPNTGDVVLIPAGTVHSLSDAVVFEVQQNSDVTFRLYDWDRLDPRTGERRPLQIDQAMACIDFEQGPAGPVIPVIQETTPVLRERLVHCDHFGVTRITARFSFTVGSPGSPRVLVCLSGHGHVEHAGADYAFSKGDVLLLPAVVGACDCRPEGVISLLEVSVPGS